MEIRVYQAEDAAKLCQIHNQIDGDGSITAVDFHNNLLAYEHQWVGLVAGEVVGYTAVSTVPGLPHIRVLHGFIAPRWQRQGLGSQLLQHLLEDLRREVHLQFSLPTLQLSQCIHDTNSAVYHFLRHHNFTIEHEEQHLLLQSPNLPITQSPNLLISTLPRSQAISQFITLYDKSFGPHPWYQPYTAGEAAALLYAPQDLLFLYHLQEPIGFAWAKMVARAAGEVEPIGIIEKWQGRGYGRFLLQAAIHNLTTRGATRVYIGTWDSNKPALHLYRSLGFEPDHTLTYLAYEVGKPGKQESFTALAGF